MLPILEITQSAEGIGTTHLKDSEGQIIEGLLRTNSEQSGAL